MIFNLYGLEIKCDKVSNNLISDKKIEYYLRGIDTKKIKEESETIMDLIKKKEKTTIDGLSLVLDEVIGDDEKTVLSFSIVD